MCVFFASIINLFFILCSHAYGIIEDEDDKDEDDTDEEDPISEPIHSCRSDKDALMKKPVTLDHNGIPYGKMKSSLANDVKLYAKDLDPTTSWERQPTWEKQCLFERLYAGMYMYAIQLAKDMHIEMFEYAVLYLLL